MSENCTICGLRILDTDVSIIVKQRGIQRLITSSQKRGDGKDVLFGESQELRLHRKCRLNYIEEKCISAHKKRKTLESTSSGTFDFANYCLFCNEKADQEFVKSQTKLPANRRIIVSKLTRPDTQAKILQAAAAHEDEWSRQVLLRIKDVSLQEKCAVYHGDCYIKFCHPMRAGAGGRRLARTRSSHNVVAMSHVYRFLSTNHDDGPFSLADIRNALPDVELPDDQVIIHNLEQRALKRRRAGLEIVTSSPVDSSTKKIELTEDQRDQLIELYKNEEVLWNRDHPSYTDRSMVSETLRSEALARIAAAMNQPDLGPTQAKGLLQLYTEMFRESLKKPTTYIQYSFWYQRLKFLVDENQGVAMDKNEGEQDMNKNQEDKTEDNEGDGAESDSSTEDYIVELKEEVTSDNEEHANALSETEEIDRLAVDSTFEDDEMATDDLEENELSPEQPSNVGNPTFAKVFVNTTKHVGIQTAAGVETDRISLKKKKPVMDDAESRPNVDKKLHAIAQKQKRIEKLLESQANKQDDMFDHFAKYVASSLRALGPYEALALQPRIVEMITERQAQKKAISDATSQNFASGSHP